MGAGKTGVLLLAAVLSWLLLPMWTTEGMFMDGSIYASLSRNLAEGHGSFWSPFFSETFHNEFYEHPPLAIGLQALFFKVFGDHFWVENLYAALMFLIHLLLIRAFWKVRFACYDGWWWAALLYALVPTISWGFGNNMLENTLGVFTGLAIYFILDKPDSLHWKNTLLVAVLIALAFFVKGPVALFPLAAPFFMWLCFRQMSFRRIAIQTLAILGISASLFAVVYFGVPEARHALDSYFSQQVGSSLAGERMDVRRTFVLERLLLELAVPLALVVLFWVIISVKNIKGFKMDSISWFLILVGISSVLPMAISPKQMAFYVIPSVFFFSMAMALISFPAVRKLLSTSGPTLRRVTFIFVLLLLGGGLVNSVINFGKPGRDREMIEDVKLIRTQVESFETVSMDSAYEKDYGVMAYFARYGNIHLDFEDDQRYYLILRAANTDEPEGYEELNMGLKKFRLYNKSIK